MADLPHRVVPDTQSTLNFEALDRSKQSDLGIVNVMDFGAVNNGTGDNTRAIARAVEVIEKRLVNTLPAGGGILYFPPGEYRISEKMLFDNTLIRIMGAQPGLARPFGKYSGTTLMVDAGVTAIEIRNGTNSLGAFSSIENLHIIGSDTTSGSNYGVKLSANSVRIRNCVVENFGGGGIHIKSGEPGDSFTVDGTYNANKWVIEYVRCYDNYGDGVRVEGIDANAGSAIGLDCTANDGYGIYDHSVLGNCYFGPHLDGNVTGAIRIGAYSNDNRFYGIYKEGDSYPALLIDAPAVGETVGRNIVDFRVLTSTAQTITDNSGTGDNVIITPLGYLKQNRLIFGDPTATTIGLAIDFSAGGTLTFNAGEFTLARTGTDRLTADCKLIAEDGLGVGNSATASSLGSLSDVMEVFDSSGTSIGYVPIYGSYS